MKRTRLRPISRKRAAERPARAAVWAAVLERDRRCALAPASYTHPGAVPACSGPLTPHHLRKASQGGGSTERNLVVCCTLHQVWIEDYPDDAYALGLVARRGDPGYDKLA